MMSFTPNRTSALFACLLLAAGTQVVSQVVPPLVSIEAVDHHASELEMDPGVLRISRTGGTEGQLLVFFQLSGTALNGSDYDQLPNSVVIPAGESSARVTIKPKDDLTVEGVETVVATLMPSLVLAPINPYQIGFPSNAIVLLDDNDRPIENRPPRVVIVTPASGTSFMAPADVQLGANATDDGPVKSLKFYSGDQLIAEADGPLTTPAGAWLATWRGVGLGEYTITARATDDLGAVGVSEPIRIIVKSGEPPAPMLIAKGSSWKYLDNGSDQGTAWRDPGFNDGEWKSGPAQLGFGDGDEATILAMGSNDRRFVTYYFRRSFELAEPGAISKLLVRLLRDDGAVVYLNGTEVLRSNLPDGPISFQTLAVMSVGEDENLFRETLIERTALKAGVNVVAVEVHQASVASSDLGFDLALLGNTEPAPENRPPVVHIVSPTNGTSFVAPARIAIRAEASDSDGMVRRLEFFAGDRSLGADEAAPFLFEWENVPAGEYLLRVRATDDDGASASSESARILVKSPATGPTVNIEATDPEGAEIPPVLAVLPNPVVFKVTRSGETNGVLRVYYRLSGVAGNGIDYRELPGLLTIPEGRWSAEVVVQPIDDALVEGTESVVASLVPLSTINPPVGTAPYVVGPKAHAEGHILDNDSDPNLPPIVRIVATFPTTAECPPDAVCRIAPGRIALTRAGPGLDRALTVFLRYEGTATPELDYPALPTEATFAAGQDFLELIVGPANDLLIEGDERVVVKLLPDRTSTGTSSPRYRVGSPDSAVVTIQDGVSDRLPVVFLRSNDATPEFCPPNADCPGINFRLERTGPGLDLPLTVHLRARGSATAGVDYRDLPAQVTFEAGKETAVLNSLAIDDTLVEGDETVILAIIGPPQDQPLYHIAGNASQTDVVIRDNDLPPPNALPVVRIVRPEAASAFEAPATIRVVVEVRDPDGWVGLVELFANEREIGEQGVVFLREPDPGQLQTFEFEWKAVPAGEYALRARATDHREGIGLSEPVRIIVRGPPIAPAVTVTSRDGFAREGTNVQGELNTAAFTLRRTGETNADLTVLCSLHGTAENGTDYESIATSVTIPAGRRTARVVVKPIDDDLKERIETVIMKLEPDPSLGPVPRYTVGWPGKAAAIIVDNDQPRPDCLSLSDSLFHLRLPGVTGWGYRLECSTDLKHWTPLCTGTVLDGAIHFVDPERDRDSHRFYRAIPEASVEQDD